MIGGSDTVIGFKALGLDTFPVNSDEEASAAFKQIFQAETDNPYAIVYVEETWAEGLSSAINKFRSDPELAIILIPGTSGNTGAGMEQVKKSVVQAVGSDIIFGGDN